MNFHRKNLTDDAGRGFRVPPSCANLSMNERNLFRTIELIDLCFKLKEAYLRRQHPGASPEKIRDLINRDILERKEQKWASPEICSTH